MGPVYSIRECLLALKPRSAKASALKMHGFTDWYLFAPRPTGIVEKKVSMKKPLPGGEAPSMPKTKLKNQG